MIELYLILEKENEKEFILFGSSYGLKDYLKTIDLSEYCYTNVLFLIDGKMNFEITKTYKKWYLNKKITHKE